MADAASFRECMTGLQLPVVFEEDNAALEGAYLELKEDPGSLVKVLIEGSIVQRPPMEGNGTRPHLLVNKFIKIMLGETCGSPYSTASFTNTYWRLTALNGRDIGRSTPGLREAHLVFHQKHDGLVPAKRSNIQPHLMPFFIHCPPKFIGNSRFQMDCSSILHHFTGGLG